VLANRSPSYADSLNRVPLNFKKPAAIYSSYGNAGLWQGNTGGKGVVFNAKLTAAQRALVTVKP